MMNLLSPALPCRFHEVYEWWEALEEAGLRPFFTEPYVPHFFHMNLRS